MTSDVPVKYKLLGFLSVLFRNQVINTCVFYLVSDDRGLFRKHTHSGTTCGFSFQVQFIVREEKVRYTHMHMHATFRLHYYIYYFI